MNPPIPNVTRAKMEGILFSVPRYTRFVHSAKVMLAVLAVILACAILFYPVIKKESGVRIAFTSIEKSAHATGTKMLNARFHGLDKDNQPYNVNAKIATQIDDNTVGLEHMTSDISLNSGSWLSVSANHGLFKMKEKLLDLQGSVDMFNDEGYEFRTEVMHVNVGDKTAETKNQVDGQGPLGTLKALGGAKIENAKQLTTFYGPVFVTVYPAQKDVTQTKEGATP